MIRISWYSWPSVICSPWVNGSLLTNRPWKEKVMGSHFWEYVMTQLWLPSWVFSLYLMHAYFTCSGGNHVMHSPMQGTLWWGIEAFCQISMWMNLEADPDPLAPVEFSETIYSLSITLTAYLWEVRSQHQRVRELSHPRFLILRNCVR